MTVILTPDQVEKRFGKHFCKGYYTMVDEKNGLAQVIDVCIARGPVEWDAVNRRRAGGVITNIKVDGSTLIMDTVIGEKEVNFGPASSTTGGHGLKSLIVYGDEVRTTWMGLAGATVGVGACIPQGPGVVRVEYPEEPVIGGARSIESTIITKKMIRVVFSVDDTDTKEIGATWAMMLKAGRACPIGRFLEHKIIQLNPEVPNKTTNCVSVGISFAVEEKDLKGLNEWIVEYIRENTYSDETTLAVFKGLKIPEEVETYGLEAKTKILTKEYAKEIASRNDVELIHITGEVGTIGAVAGIGCFDMGLRSAALVEDFDSL